MKTFRAWDLSQTFLFPPSVLDFVPPEHPAHFVRELVRNELDLAAIVEKYPEGRGQPPYHPALMTSLLLYSYCRGLHSSRKIEAACRERVDFMAVTGMAKPDHSTISLFRKEHLLELQGLFAQVLQLCADAGLVKLGHVAVDGTKVKANASKHKAMSYERMQMRDKQLEADIRRWFEQADREDAEEDAKYGKDRRGDELPDWVTDKEKMREKIREAKARLEEQAKEKAKRLAEERAERERERGTPCGGPPPRALSGIPEPKAQVNFTDAESRIMKTRNGYEQAYNCQIAVDAASQVIVAESVTQNQNDGDELPPLVVQMKETVGLPEEISADYSYCSEENLEFLERSRVRAYVATGRQKHDATSPTAAEQRTMKPIVRAMRARLRRGALRSHYRLRKQVVEPVFGQIKEARGFRRFSLRGILKVLGEWSLVCTAHNLLKLAGARLAVA